MDSQTRVAHHHDGDATHVHADNSAVGMDKTFTDPVCGMKVSADPAKKIVHAGHDYFFCSVGCMTKFRASSQSYLDTTKAREQEQEQPLTQAGTIYTCPMHPEIRKTEPGSCPICGMALEPVMPSLDDEENPELVNFRHRFWWTLPLSIVVFVLAMFGHMVFPEGIPNQNIIELVLSTPVVLWAGWPFFVRCVHSVLHRSPNMWTLIGSGVAAAYGYSVVATFVPIDVRRAWRTCWCLLRSRRSHRFLDPVGTNPRAACAVANLRGNQIPDGLGPKDCEANQEGRN